MELKICVCLSYGVQVMDATWRLMAGDRGTSEVFGARRSRRPAESTVILVEHVEVKQSIEGGWRRRVDKVK